MTPCHHLTSITTAVQSTKVPPWYFTAQAAAEAVAHGDTVEQALSDTLERCTHVRSVISVSAIELLVRSEAKSQSEQGGIGVTYLLSADFLDLAKRRCQLEDPNFYDMKDVFFFGDDAIGKDIICPRDYYPFLDIS